MNGIGTLETHQSCLARNGVADLHSASCLLITLLQSYTQFCSQLYAVSSLYFMPLFPGIYTDPGGNPVFLPPMNPFNPPSLPAVHPSFLVSTANN